MKDPNEQCEGGDCCSARCTFIQSGKACGQRIPGTTKACVRKARCDKIGNCKPSAVKVNPNKKCKKIGGGKGHCNTTTGVCQ